jgi:hypothetical protein
MADSFTLAEMVAATRAPATPHITDEQILLAIGTDGRRTSGVADKLGVPRNRPAIYRRLLKLEKAGKISRQDRHTFINSIRWERANG